MSSLASCKYYSFTIMINKIDQLVDKEETWTCKHEENLALAMPYPKTIFSRKTSFHITQNLITCGINRPLRKQYKHENR